MYLRAVGRCFTQMNAYFLVMNSKRCRTEEIQLTALKNFQVSKALVVAAEKIPLNVPKNRSET